MKDSTIIILSGEPKSTGHIYRHACRGGFPSVYMNAEGKKIKEDYIAQAKKQYKGKIISGDVQLVIRLYFGTKRKADWDNFHKLSMDALTGIVWEDDSQIQEVLVIKMYDKEKPRIEIEIC